MSDSFADLWNSSVPSKPQPLKLGTAPTTNNSFSNRRPQQDVFALLSSTTSSTSSSRSITPSMAQQKPTMPKPTPNAGGGDAFSGLLSGSLAASNNARMTMAERAAQAERQKLEDLKKNAVTTQASSGTWAGLDSLANSSSPATLKPSGVSSDPQSLLGDDWGFGSAPASKPTPPIVNSGNAVSLSVDDDQDDWGLHDFGASASRASSQSKSYPPASTEPKSIWDHEEDILGALSKPVDSMPKRPSPLVRRLVVPFLPCIHQHLTYRITIIQQHYHQTIYHTELVQMGFPLGLSLHPRISSEK